MPLSSVPGPCKLTILWFSGTGCSFACSSVAKEGLRCVLDNSAQHGHQAASALLSARLQELIPSRGYSVCLTCDSLFPRASLELPRGL